MIFVLIRIHFFFFFFFFWQYQHLAEALGPLSREKDKLYDDHNELKAKLDKEYEEQSDQKRNYQQEVDSLLKIASKIKE